MQTMKMKNYLMMLCVAAAVMTALPATAQSYEPFVPVYCSAGYGGRPVVAPVSEITFSFYGSLAGSDGATGRILRGDEIMAEGPIEVSNYAGQKRTQSFATIRFDGELLLPKGYDYTVVVPEGVLWFEDNPSVRNAELTADFTVPAAVPPADHSIKDGSAVATLDDGLNSVTFYYRIETKDLGETRVTLLREGVPVRTLPATTTYDWDLGQTWVQPDEPLHFEKGVDYSLVLPAGSVSALYRDDIVNEELRINFTGDYAEPLPVINWTWCSLFDESDLSCIGDVKLYYDRAVSVMPGKMVRIYENNGRLDNLLAEAEAETEVTREDGLWVVTARFGGADLSAYSGYALVTPDDMVVSADGEMAVGEGSVTPFGTTTGIGTAAEATDLPAVTAGKGCIIINNVKPGDRIDVYTAAGMHVTSFAADTDNARIGVPGKGIYVVKAARKPAQRICVN